MLKRPCSRSIFDQGGDGPSPNVLVILAGGLRDVSKNILETMAQLPLLELRDTVARL